MTPTQLRALVEGRLDQWSGLPDCSRADVEGALGAGVEQANARRDLGDLVLRHAPQPAAPCGVLVWYRARRATVLLLNPVALAADPVRLLGKPDLVRPSQTSEGMLEQIWATRGIVAQIGPLRKSARMLQAFPAMSLDEFTAGPLGRFRNIP